jgi:hypothetical protein
LNDVLPPAKACVSYGQMVASAECLAAQGSSNSSFVSRKRMMTITPDAIATAKRKNRQHVAFF